MIKLFLHKAFATSLAILVLFSTLSITIEKHFCGNTLVDVALFTEAEKCKMEALEIELEKITKKSCCKDIVDVIEGQDELKLNSNDDLTFDNKVYIATFFKTYVNLFEELPKLIIPHKDYSPPDLFYDRQIIDQVFII